MFLPKAKACVVADVVCVGCVRKGVMAEATDAAEIIETKGRECKRLGCKRATPPKLKQLCHKLET